MFYIESSAVALNLSLIPHWEHLKQQQQWRAARISLIRLTALLCCLPCTEDMSAEDASMTHRECSFPYFFMEYMFCCVWSEYCSVGYIITDSTVANSAQPCFTESFTNVRVKSTQGDTGSVAVPMCMLHSKSSLAVFRISSLCRCNKYRQFLKQKKTLAGWHQHCSAAASRSSNATKTALERIWSLNHSWLTLNDRGNYISWLVSDGQRDL